MTSIQLKRRQKWRELSLLGEDHIFLEKDSRYDSLDKLKNSPIDRVVILAAMPGLSANWSQEQSITSVILLD